MEILDRYIDQLLEKSSPQAPIWNIEKIRQGAKPSWNYIDGCMIKAILELYHIKKNPAYLEFADAFIDYFVREDGSILSYDPKEYNLDNVNAGKTLFDLYKLTGKAKYRKAMAQPVLMLFFLQGCHSRFRLLCTFKKCRKSLHDTPFKIGFLFLLFNIIPGPGHFTVMALHFLFQGFPMNRA